MKKILLTALVLSFTTFASHAQTTLAEYNYVTKGYKNHLEDGSDLKKGYTLLDVTEVQTNSGDGKIRKAWLKSFVLTDRSPYRAAAYMVIYQLDNNPKEFICIPHPNSEAEIRNKFFNALHDGTNDNSYRLQLITLLLSRNLTW